MRVSRQTAIFCWNLFQLVETTVNIGGIEISDMLKTMAHNGKFPCETDPRYSDVLQVIEQVEAANPEILGKERCLETENSSDYYPRYRRACVGTLNRKPIVVGFPLFLNRRGPFTHAI